MKCYVAFTTVWWSLCFSHWLQDLRKLKVCEPIVTNFSIVKCDTKTEKNFCLRYFSYAATFKDAQIECKQHNLSLVTLSTKSQQEFLREFQTNVSYHAF